MNTEGHGATIFNVSSAGGYNGNPGLSFYSASKFGTPSTATSFFFLINSYLALEGFTESFSKEMLPEWGIKCCILEPGGFETGWLGAGIQTPVHPAYANSPANFRSLRSSITMLGDPAKGANAILKLSKQNKLPLRVQLGSDSLAIVQTKARMVIRDTEMYSDLSRSTDKDGMDGIAYGEMIIKRLEKS